MGPSGQPINMPSSGTPGADWAARIQQQAAMGTALAPAGQPADPLSALVYLGEGTRGGGAADDTPRGFGSTASSPAVPTDATVDIDSLLNQFEGMGHAQQRRLLLLLTIGGFAGSTTLENAAASAKDMTLQEAMEAYLSLLNTAAAAYAGGRKVTPEQMLEQAVAFRLPRGADWDGTYSGLVDVLQANEIPTLGADDTDKKEEPVDLSGTRTTTNSSTNTSTSVSRDIMDPNDAMALTRAMLQRELGRDPTKAEFEDFIGAVQAAQAAHPTRTRSTVSSETTTTSTLNKKGRVTDTDTDTTNSSSSTRHAGITSAGINDILLRKARANPDWAEWQAVGTYAPALFQALGATVPGV